MKVGELELELSGVIENEKKLLMELMPEVLPSLKEKIKESAIDASDESDGVSAASARVPVAYAVLAAYQLRWIVGQVTVSCAFAGSCVYFCEIEEEIIEICDVLCLLQLEAPCIGKLCPFMIPCSLVALDHWSPEVKVSCAVDISFLDSVKFLM